MVREDEVDVVRGPADHEDDCGEGEHLDDLLLVVPALGQGGLGHLEPVFCTVHVYCVHVYMCMCTCACVLTRRLRVDLPCVQRLRPIWV